MDGSYNLLLLLQLGGVDSIFSKSMVLAPAYGLLHVLAGLREPIKLYFCGVKNLQLIYYRTSIFTEHLWFLEFRTTVDLKLLKIYRRIGLCGW